MQLKRLLSLILSLILCMSAFIFPFMKAVQFSYAINDDNLWQPLESENELVEVFQDYCKSRDLTIEGSVADAVTTATTGTFNGLCNKLGIDITALQADLKKSTDQAGNVQWLFNSNGITAYNRIFAQFLQDNELEVGDSVPSDRPKYIYDGKMDPESKALIWIINSNYSNDQPFPAQYFIYRGSFYYYNGDALKRLSDQNGNQVTYIDLPIDTNNNFKVAVKYYSYLTGRIEVSNFSNNYNSRVVWGRQSAGTFTYGSESGLILMYDQRDQNYYYGSYNRFNSSDVVKEGVSFNGTINKYNYQPTNVNVYITTNNNTINNNNYEGDTIINEYGVPSDPNEPDPNDPNYDPYPDGGGTTTGPNNTGGGSGEDDTDVTFPNFDFQLPEIDWSLGDLSDKFPFSIPFDLIAFFTVLNATPEAPAIDAEIPLGDWYTWHFEADFSQFDNYAAIIRNVEFIAFCIGLIYLTIRLVKG